MKKQLMFISAAFLVALVAATVSSAAEIILTWDAQEGCSYEVHYGPASRQYDHNQPVTTATCTLELPPGIYYFSVNAHLIDCPYTLCVGEYSDEVSVMLLDKPEIATIALGIK